VPFTVNETPPERPSQIQSTDGRQANTGPEARHTVCRVLITSGILGRTDTAVAAALSRQFEPRYFSPGHAVFAQGEVGDTMYGLISGKVKVSHRCPGGRENVLTILRPPEIFGETTFFDPGPRQFSVTALTALSAITLNRDRSWRGSPNARTSPNRYFACSRGALS
jgi:Cyclic nucleotide-binding domain